MFNNLIGRIDFMKKHRLFLSFFLIFSMILSISGESSAENIESNNNEEIIKIIPQISMNNEIKTIGEKSIINISDFSNIKIIPEELGKNTITEEYPNGKWWVEKEELRETKKEADIAADAIYRISTNSKMFTNM